MNATAHPSGEFARIRSLLREQASSLTPQKLMPAPTGHGAEPTYVEMDVDGRELFVISDLHLADGLQRDRTFSGTENFFCDAAFLRFIEYTVADLTHRGATARLVINGDFVDFMRIAVVPSDDGIVNFDEWEQILRRIGIDDYSADDLRKTITKKELKFGLRTHDFKSVWKLERSVRGHLPVFNALSAWIHAGHELVIVKGNHDLEWLWKPVRDHLCVVLAEGNRDRHSSIEDALAEVLARIHFVKDGLLVGKSVYIEHGHRFDPITRVIGPDVLKDRPHELNIPFGSFFNRYLINHVELDYPYIDNVRPQTGVVALLLRERFPQAIKLLFSHIPFTLRTVPKGYYRYFLRQLLPVLIALLLPVAIAVALLWNHIPLIVDEFQDASSDTSLWGRIFDGIVGVAGRLSPVFASWVLGQIVAAAQLSKPATLEEPARNEILATHPEWDAVVMGHTHDPRQSGRRYGRKEHWFFNAGTWVPVVEIAAASIRHDRTYTYVHFPLDGAGFAPGTLWRWVDEAGRPEVAAAVNRVRL